MKRFSVRNVIRAAGLLAVLSLASTSSAREGVLKTTGGLTYRGDIREEETRYIVTVDKIDTPIDKSQVASVDYTGTIDEQFDERMKALDPKDAQGRVTVARFAFDHGRNDLAIQALSSAMQIDPNNADAIAMLKTVDAQQQLARTQADKAAAAKPAAAETGNPAPPASQPAGKLLTTADMNRIRLYERHPDESLTFTMSADARKKFFTDTGMSPLAFGQMSQADQLTAIVNKGSDEVIAGTKVMHDPAAIVQFRRSIQPAVLRNCATIGCHGGSNGGQLVLFNATDDASTYTNFYILEQYAQTTKGDGSFFGGASQRKLIERGNSAHSLLINYALPARVGDVSHPPIVGGGMTNIFRGRSGPVYDQFTDWMDHTLNMIPPNYGIKYDIPRGTSPTSQPAKQ
ncbi:MAG: hypothetical protein JO353_04590 [Phycisphaerae bacterium]|nr:hypothetical protein [Phycisphaerae bacterium]